ncbi:MAG: HAD family phosphatase [Chloroflexi bacterium]|nr:HAD family phosphatase [Chloroflexota bacterium]
MAARIQEPLAILFDLDGTLIDTLPLHLSAERRALADYGVEIDASDHPQTFGSGILPGMAMLADHYGIHDLQAFTDHYLSLWNAEIDENLAPTLGAIEFLNSAANSKARAALVTSGEQVYAEHVIEKLGIAGLFDAVVTSDVVSRPKPAPEAYLLACELLHVAPGRAIGFEDSASGFRSLAAAGIEAVAIGHTRGDCPDGCSAHAHHMDFTSVVLTEL